MRVVFVNLVFVLPVGRRRVVGRLGVLVDHRGSVVDFVGEVRGILDLVGGRRGRLVADGRFGIGNVRRIFDIVGRRRRRFLGDGRFGVGDVGGILDVVRRTRVGRGCIAAVNR